jgi:hypothetical protein
MAEVRCVVVLEYAYLTNAIHDCVGGGFSNAFLWKSVTAPDFFGHDAVE